MKNHIYLERPLRSFLRRLAVLVALVAVCLAVVAPAPTAAYASSPHGYWGYYWAQVDYQIVGTGQYVDQWVQGATNETWPGTLEIEMRVVGPAGFDTGWVLKGVNLGAHVSFTVNEYANVSKGSYCSQEDIYGEPVAQHCYSVT